MRSRANPWRTASLLLVAVSAMAGLLSQRVAAKPRASAGNPSAIRDAWVREFSEKRLESTMQLYAADSVFHTGMGERFEGADKIRELMQGAMATNTVSLKLRPLSSGSSGNLAYDSGDYNETVTRNGVSRNLEGTYLMVFKRQSDGKWLVQEQIWTEHPMR